MWSTYQVISSTGNTLSEEQRLVKEINYEEFRNSTFYIAYPR